jgi:glycosyltransferase involved in cell wall biosynthesis
MFMPEIQKPKLSILIPTLKNRRQFFVRLYANLDIQKNLLEDSGQVEILYDTRDDISIGEKRNNLLAWSKGDYVAFIDDDDLVAPNYIELVLKAIESKPDVVGMNLIMTTDGQNAERSFHTIQCKEWFEKSYIFQGKKIYFRCPNHLNPVKRELALQVKFPDISMGEDKDYSYRLLPLLKTEEWIDQPIYFYLFRRNK